MVKAFWFFLGSIVYTYFGYPLIITGLARFFPKRNIHCSSLPSTTLLIAAYNEEDILDEKIQNCLKLEYPCEKLQILVVTDGSVDNSPNIVKKYVRKGVELLHKPVRMGKMAAINRALPFARGEIIVFSDANNFYTQESIKELVKPFADPQVGAVNGAKGIIKGDGSLGEAEGLYWRYESFINRSEDRVSSCTSAVGEIMAIRKSLYIYPPDEIINDDFYQVMGILRNGYRVAYAPKARSYERVSISAEHEIRRRTRIVMGRYQVISMGLKILPLKDPLLLWQIISHKFLRPLVPFFLIGMFIINLLAIFTQPKHSRPVKKLVKLERPYSLIFLVGQTLFYFIALIGRNIENKSKDDSWKKILYIPTFLINSNLAALRGMIQFVRGQQTNLWDRIPRRK
jgi:cellulose synthase/poly-beta-1,6-N-acetylglucosamine synthase-like glycosyltransferase